MVTSRKAIKTLFALVSVSATTLILSGPAQADWWDTNWRWRRKLTFDNTTISEDLTNFPVLVHLTSGNFNFSRAQNNGEDIRFLDADGTNLLKHEIEEWDKPGSNAWIWVKVPLIEAGSTTDFIHVYYSNFATSDQEDATNVWDSNFVMVQHMNETSGTHYDSTANTNNGTLCAASSTNQPVTDEAFLSDHDTAVNLSQRSLQPDSDVVTTIDGAITNIRNTDYTMDYADGKITVLSTGNMSDGGSVTDEQFNSTNLDQWVQLSHVALSSLHAITVTDTNGSTTYTNLTDYEMDYNNGRIKCLGTGTMESNTDYEIDYTYGYYYIDYAFDNTAYQDAQGKIDGADMFDGIDDYVEAPSSSSLTNRSFLSVEVWVKWTSPPAGYEMLVAKDYGTKFYPSYRLFYDGANICFGIYSTNWGYHVGPNKPFTPTAGQWYYIVGSYSDATNAVKIYVDAGTPSQAYGDGDMCMNDKRVCFGQRDAGSWQLNGVLDEVRISDTVRSTNWIAAQYLNMTDTYITYLPPVHAPRGTAITIR